jgi:hypothetical protein
MASKYRLLIDRYCARHQVGVPPGFARGAPQRYAIIRTHVTPPKLIAKTWFNVTDVVYHIEHFLLPELGDALSMSIQVLDFKDGEVLAYSGGKRLDRVETFSVTDQPPTA